MEDITLEVVAPIVVPNIGEDDVPNVPWVEMVAPTGILSVELDVTITGLPTPKVEAEAPEDVANTPSPERDLRLFPAPKLEGPIRETLCEVSHLVSSMRLFPHEGRSSSPKSSRQQSSKLPAKQEDM